LNANHLASIATRPQSTESLHASSAKNDPDGARTLDANRSFRAFRATPTQSAASHRITDFVRIPPASMAFTLLMSFLSALPSFAIDMSLPAITETAASLRVAPAQAGLMMSLFMVGFAVAPLFYGPASDRYGRKPIVVFACMLFVIAGIGCALAQSLPTLLMWRVVQGAGAGASMTIALAIIRDLFEGQAARTKLFYVTIIQETIERISARTDTPQNDLVESRFTETTTCPGNNEDNDDEAAVVPERSAQATTRLVAADVRLHRRPPVIAGGLCQAMRPRSVMSRRCRSRCVGSVPDGHLTAEFISDVTR
jgi:hypothetical protein